MFMRKAPASDIKRVPGHRGEKALPSTLGQNVHKNRRTVEWLSWKGALRPSSLTPPAQGRNPMITQVPHLYKEEPG